ncbi:conserved domain protein [Bacteroides fluxus YIT 12057]|uniref:Conserved domain protein n=1 Tax=Bacteroides fluxus YIT 12057 TaxID=763034 RepID=F3PS27_9BACE|nr:conserved domain protein [Bacteroides fluxus YIT 12057]
MNIKNLILQQIIKKILSVKSIKQTQQPKKNRGYTPVAISPVTITSKCIYI